MSTNIIITQTRSKINQIKTRPNLIVLFFTEFAVPVTVSLKLVFSKRVIFAFEKRYFEKDLSN